MSRKHHEREEKVCLNCGATIHGRYCHSCGQENVEPRESFWHLARHVVEDITHFDGKLFITLKYLFSKPGYLTEEYTMGRRAPYIHPVRLYLFTSAVFFLLMFSAFRPSGPQDPRVAYVRDSIEQHNSSNSLSLSSRVVGGVVVTYLQFNHLYAVNGAHVYDSIQNTLPATSPNKDGYFRHLVRRKVAKIASVYHKDPNQFIEHARELFYHSFSKVFFISLPLFALMLTLLNMGVKNSYYVGNAVFSIHFYCVIFIVTLFGFFLGYIDQSGITSEIIILGSFIYLFVAMKRFYKKPWYWTLVTFSVQSIFFTLIFLMLVAAFGLGSIVSLAE